MILYAIVNTTTGIQRGIPFERQQRATDIKDEDMQYLPDYYIVEKRESRRGEAYVPALGLAPAYSE